MMSSEDEIYSTMFSSLKHPARRKILRMLSEKPLTFSQMLEALDISSSHLTYHLESLGELLSKTEDGKYRLSSFGEASVNTMKKVEEAPITRSKRLSALPLRWKTLFAFLIVGMILLASLSTVQYVSLNQMAATQDDLQATLNQVNTENQQLLSWGAGTDKAVVFIRDVAQIDITQYHATLLSDTVEYRSDLGGVLEEVLKYSLISSQSRIDIVLRYRNNHFSRYQLYLDEGTPIYSQPQSTDPVTALKGLIERYQNYTNEAYLVDMSNIMAQATVESNGTIVNQTKFQISGSPNNQEVLLMYVENGVDFSAKSLRAVYQNGLLTEFTDGWYLLTVGSTEVNVDSQQAIQIALDAVEDFSWEADETEISEFNVVEGDATAQFIPHPREDASLDLVPYWYVTLPLDKVYPDQVNRITVGVWADTGEVANIQAIRG
ncbi:MAG: winged helix-turn-helix domain-containing protein [Candidatus Bathyarchaeota archaeon]|nr:winged helix-turn-helix domain-containing protein [Candidatus Bathyarchaeota archaeon]